MPLFGSSRDVSLINNINRELLGRIIVQQASFYKYKLEETDVNSYGEASAEKFYDGPFIFNCLIDRQDQVYSYGVEGINFNQMIKVAFFKKDLEEAQVMVEPGDIILYQESYYAVSGLVENQYFIGKNPDYPNSPNPYDRDLADYGSSISVVCVAYYIPADKVAISPYAER